VGARAPSVVVVAASVALIAAGVSRSATPKPPVTIGYPYAASCPQAGDRDDVDRWSMNTCNCTSYVAWALEQNGYRTAWFILGRMDARNWPDVARLSNFAVGDRPRVGAVAVWPRWSPFGHVAFVTAVRANGSFDVAEYNVPGRPPFQFSHRTGLSTRGAQFIYVPRRESESTQ
jgi:surface antigen